MVASKNCIDLVKRFEGLRKRAYLDPVGIPTIGYGHTEGVKLGMYVTDEQAEALLAEDLIKFSNLVKTQLKVPVTQNQFDALVSFAYNVRHWESSSLIHLVNEGDFEAAARWFDKYVFARGTMLTGLVRRRAAERDLFLA